MLQKRTLLDSTNLNNAFLSRNATGEQAISSSLKASGGVLTLKNSVFTDSANAGYLRIDPQGNAIIIYDGVSNQRLSIHSSSGSEKIDIETINGATSYGKIDAVGVDHLKINSGGKATKLGGALHFEGNTQLQSDTQFSFLTIGGGAQVVKTGGILTSDTYADATKIPTSGIYAKGGITTGGGLTSASLSVSGNTDVNTLSLNNGSNLLMKSNASNDAGDIIFQNTAGAEIGRMYTSTTSINMSVGATVADKLKIQSDGKVYMQHLYLGLGTSGTVEGSIYNVDGFFGTNDIRFGIGTTPYHFMNATGLSLGKTTAPNATLDVAGRIYSNTAIQTDGYYQTAITNDYAKIRFLSESYAIGSSDSMTYGYMNGHGITFTSGTEGTSGFVWRDNADVASDGAMSLTTNGKLYVKDIVNAGSVNSRGSFTGSGVISMNGANSGMELGSISATGTPYIDFHSSGGNIDYDARIIASGGSATTAGQGKLDVYGTLRANTAFVLPVGTNKYAT